MGKSIRSKSVLRAKSVKRSGEFAKYVDARNKRISEKLTEDLSKQAKPETKTTQVEEKMDEDAKKISTSGWKSSRKSVYKQSLIKNKKRKNHMKF